MDLRDSAEEAEFRAGLRAWLAENLPTEPEPHNLEQRFGYMRDWQRSLYAGGWTALSWPKEYGGQGLGLMEEAILSQELGRANAPTSLPTLYLGRPFLTHGTREQQQRYLPNLLSAQELWCQAFSEPGAGSDLSALKAAAVLEGDVYRISGQKTWTSYAVFSDYCLLLARTDSQGRPHEGISAFILKLDSPGVTVRPIVLGNSDEEFAELFLDDVRVNAADMLGKPGDGWAIAMEVISYERGAVDVGYQAKYDRMLSELIAQARARSRLDDPFVSNLLGEIGVHLDVLRMHCLRRLSTRASGGLPGPDSSIDKLLMTRIEQHLLAVAMEFSDDQTTTDRSTWFDHYVYARAGSIFGGSAQIQKNILAQRMLGLPRG